jgi:hypothetical protein
MLSLVSHKLVHVTTLMLCVAGIESTLTNWQKRGQYCSSVLVLLSKTATGLQCHTLQWRSFGLTMIAATL